jgi:hypothetical protein
MERKRYPWEGIVLVPFIDQHRLLAAIPDDSVLTKVCPFSCELSLLFNRSRDLSSSFSFVLCR